MARSERSDLQWSRRPPTGATLPSTPIHRLGRGTSLTAIVLSDDVLGVNLHWMGRSVPCTGDAHCPGCTAEKPSPTRWEGYLGIWYPRTNGVAITPITAGAVSTLDTFRAQHGTLRGAEITCSRTGLKSNAPLNVSLKRGDVPALHLPPEPDVAAILRHVWKLPARSIAEELAQERKERPVAVPFGGDDFTVADRRNGRAVHA